MRTKLLIPVLVLLITSHAECAQELYRIRVFNSESGAIEVSADEGKTYLKIGKVTRPATASSVGYLASIYAVPGTVAATAVHGIRIKTAGSKECSRSASKVMSIVPAEFAQAPKGFGGYSSDNSAILTDIPTGRAIFRNLAPLVGNRVFKQMGNDLVPIPDGYVPQEHDILVIEVTIPDRYPDAITIENRKGGLVKAVYSDRRETIAKVQRPVRGVGRFDATGYTGVGRINTSHTGVLTISTAPIVDGAKDGGPVETRGGFMIQPSRHGREALEVAQVMIVEPVSEAWLEGAQPLFSGYFGLFYDPTDETKSFLVEARKEGADWMPLPQLVGVHEDALASFTDFRIRFPKLTSEWVKAQLAQRNAEYMEICRAKAARDGTLVSGTLTIQMAGDGLEGTKYVRLYVDGVFRGAINAEPYVFNIDTSALSKAEHLAEMRATDASGATMRQITKVFFVQ